MLGTPRCEVYPSLQTSFQKFQVPRGSVLVNLWATPILTFYLKKNQVSPACLSTLKWRLHLFKKYPHLPPHPPNPHPPVMFSFLSPHQLGLSQQVLHSHSHYIIFLWASTLSDTPPVNVLFASISGHHKRDLCWKLPALGTALWSVRNICSSHLLEGLLCTDSCLSAEWKLALFKLDSDPVQMLLFLTRLSSSALWPEELECWVNVDCFS